MGQKQDLIDYNFLLRGDILSKRKLFEFLANGKRETRTKSVPSLRAQSFELCEVDKQEFVNYSQIITNIEKLKKRNLIVYYVANLQFEHGLRISEVLNISVYDILNTGHFFLKGAKGSNNRIYYSAIVASYFIKCKQYKINPFAELNRFYVYREYKKVSLNFFFGDNKKQSVTHFLRHAIAREIYESDNDYATIADYLRHKSLKSTKYYTKNATAKKQTT